MNENRIFFENYMLLKSSYKNSEQEKEKCIFHLANNLYSFILQLKMKIKN